MKKKIIDITDVLEVYFFGLSLLIGSEQFYTLVSQTKASPEFQWYLFLLVVFGTLVVILILPNDHFGDFIHLAQLYYVFPLALLFIFVWVKVTSVLVTTSITVGLGVITTFLVIEACIHYSYSTELVLTFLAGLLSARMLPSFCWILTQGEDNESQFRKMSLTLALARLSFFLVSLSIISLKGRYPVLTTFNFNQSDDIFGRLTKDFKQLQEYYCKIINNYSSKECILTIVRHAFSIGSFYLSLILFFPLTPVIQVSGGKKTYFNYAPHMITSLTRADSFFHFCGFCIGIMYPVTITHRGTDYYFMNLIVYIPYLIIVGYLRYFGRSFSQYGIYLIIMVLAFGLGYNCSYNLGVIINAILIQNCKNQEILKFPCCGDKFLTECYCRYPMIINRTNHCHYSPDYLYTSKPCKDIVKFDKYTDIGNYTSTNPCVYANRFTCSKFERKYSRYDLDGKYAIIICVEASTLSQCFETTCSENCCQQECTKDKCKCIKLIGIYKLDVVTTSVCDECQLTVRLEAKKNTSCSTCRETAGSGSFCSCGGQGTNLSCLCVKCCEKDCCDKSCKEGKCSCIKFCCCRGGCKSCKCKCEPNSNEKDGTRVFICFTQDGKSCLREIKPNTSPEFDGVLNNQNNFYIKTMFISDCCHSDIIVDLYCKMNNNFFRVTEIKYPNKPKNPTRITLCRKDSKCCAPTSKDQCCSCSNNSLQRLLTSYSDESVDEKCSCSKGCSGCKCCKNGNCCCCIGAVLTISTDNLYEKTMKPIKLKLVTIFWLLFALILVVMYLAASKDKGGDIKYYNFNPVTSHRIIIKKTRKNTFNTADEVKRRIDWFLMESGLESDSYKDDLDHMLKLFDCTLDPGEFTFLKKNLDEVSFQLLNNPVFILRAKIELVTWSCCLGFVYGYIIEMFVRIQSYFIKWEPLWRREYYNYRQLISKNINKITYGSKFAVAASNELEIGFKTRMLISKSRKETWASAFDKVEGYLDLYDKEIELPEEQLPGTIEERLQYYINRWDDRVTYLEEWTSSSTNVFDWDTFLIQYPDIRTWVNMFSKYIRLVSQEFDLNQKKFNKGIEIFENYKIN